MLQHGLTAAAFRSTLPKNFGTASRIAIAVSGGVDSIALAHLLQQQIQDLKLSLYAFTVDHKLRPGSADEAYEVQKLLKSRGLHHEVLSIPKLPMEEHIEEDARIARYNALTLACLKHKIRDLYLAHHADDQAETLLLRLTAGSRWPGLRGMTSIAYNPISRDMHNASSIFLHRPLLNVPKSLLIETCRRQNIPWFEDHTNNEVNLTSRNAIRSILRQADALPKALKPPSLLSVAEQLGERYKALQQRQAVIARKCEISLCEVTASVKFTLKPLHEAINEIEELELFLESIAMIVSPMADPRRSRIGVLREVFQHCLRDNLSRTTSACGLTWTIQDGHCVVSRQQYERSEDIAADVMAVSDSREAQNASFDRRHFIKAYGRPCKIVIRPIRRTDIRRLRELARQQTLEDRLESLFKQARGATRFTLPIALDKLTDEILALPSAGLVFDSTLQFECELIGQPFKERLLAGTVEDHYYSATQNAEL